MQCTTALDQILTLPIIDSLNRYNKSLIDPYNVSTVHKLLTVKLQKKGTRKPTGNQHGLAESEISEEISLWKNARLVVCTISLQPCLIYNNGFFTSAQCIKMLSPFAISRAVEVLM